MHDAGVCLSRDGFSGASSEPRGCLSPIRLQHPCPCRGTWGGLLPTGAPLKGASEAVSPPRSPPKPQKSRQGAAREVLRPRELEERGLC